MTEFSGSAGTNAPRTMRPSSVRTGMFCRFGSEEERRPVAVTVWLYEVCTRPSPATSSGRASRYVDLIFAFSRYSSTSATTG